MTSDQITQRARQSFFMGLAALVLVLGLTITGALRSAVEPETVNFHDRTAEWNAQHQN